MTILLRTEVQLEELALSLINMERRNKGLHAYTRDRNLDTGARAHSRLLRNLDNPWSENDVVCPAVPLTMVHTWSEEWGPNHWCKNENSPINELSPVQRIQPDWQNRQPPIFPGENVGRGQGIFDPGWRPYETLVRQIHDYFMRSADHYKNFVNADYNTVRIGVAYSMQERGARQGALVWLTEDFARF